MGVTNPLLQQFEAYLTQLDQMSSASVNEQLQRWSNWARKLEQQASELAPDHQQLIHQLTDCSVEWGELLAELNRISAAGGDFREQLERLRQSLHQFNLQQILAKATLPQHFISLIFTQTQAPALLKDEQTAQLKRVAEQLQHPGFEALKKLINALLDWQLAASSLNQEMALVSDAAIEQFVAACSDAVDQDEILKRWTQSYDQAFRDAFNQRSLQQAQGGFINSLSQLQLCWQALVEQLAQPLGIPNRKQIDQLIEQLDQQRRRIRKLELELELLKREHSQS